MIATCGHKTDEPISFSYYDGDPNGVSYGSKCFDCFMSTPINYIHNSELVKVRNIIQRQAKIISLLKQSNEFYADMNLMNEKSVGFSCEWYVNSNDFEEIGENDYCKTQYYYGKLARSIKQQVEEIENG